MTEIEHICINVDDAVELIDMFGFFCAWFDYDRARLEKSLWGFTPGGTSLAELRGELLGIADRLGAAPMRTGPHQ